MEKCALNHLKRLPLMSAQHQDHWRSPIPPLRSSPSRGSGVLLVHSSFAHSGVQSLHGFLRLPTDRGSHGSPTEEEEEEAPSRKN
ncbi:dystrophin-related protein 2-like isoform X1 [Arapaima gigas]